LTGLTMGLCLETDAVIFFLRVKDIISLSSEEVNKL
jgi:hypothetical protein